MCLSNWKRDHTQHRTKSSEIRTLDSIHSTNHTCTYIFMHPIQTRQHTSHMTKRALWGQFMRHVLQSKIETIEKKWAHRCPADLTRIQNTSTTQSTEVCESLPHAMDLHHLHVCVFVCLTARVQLQSRCAERRTLAHYIYRLAMGVPELQYCLPASSQAGRPP